MEKESFRGKPLQHVSGDADSSHHFSISLPLDKDGRLARTCPNEGCSPGQFKIVPGTGTPSDKDLIHCPYCRERGKTASFSTPEQVRYAESVASMETNKDIQDMLKKSLSPRSSGYRELSREGLLDISLPENSISNAESKNPHFDILKRNLRCPECGQDHTVYGLGIWCPGCGQDIFTTHVLRELHSLRSSVQDIPRREKELGIQTADRDMDRACDELESLFRATINFEAKRYASTTKSPQGSEDLGKFTDFSPFSLQDFRNLEHDLKELFGLDFEGLAPESIQAVVTLFQRERPKTQKLEIVDRTVFEEIRMREGQVEAIRISPAQLLAGIEAAFTILEAIHLRLFPGAITANSEKPE